ncbi:MAG TPA: DUF3489 domain-containing protein [Stellaceae bacterium]|nr:DUF3489 domain-containing protein [Stellaceae bacterium]
MIHGESVTAHASAPPAIPEGVVIVKSIEDIEASTLSKAQLAAIWNALPGATPIARFKDRKAGAQRLWAAFAQLPVDPEPVGGAAGPRPGSKQAQVIDLLKRPEGATVAEIMAATAWQPHTVRGMFAGALKKKLALTVVSAKEERGRVYRIAAQGHA